VNEESVQVMGPAAAAGCLDALVFPELLVPAVPVDLGTRTLVERVPEVERAPRGPRVGISSVVVEQANALGTKTIAQSFEQREDALARAPVPVPPGFAGLHAQTLTRPIVRNVDPQNVDARI
jgi:hypothetical protein